MKRIWRWRTLVVLLALVFIISAVWIVWDGLADDIHTADVALVMGAKVKPDGIPSHRLLARLDRTLSLYRQGLFEFVIVSGGLGWEGYDEAQVMAQYLVDRNVPEENIIIDNQGYDTYASAQNVSRIMQVNDLQSVLVITQYFHVSRTKLALGRFGISKIYSANATYWGLRDLLYVPREVIAYYYYLLRSYD